MLWVGGGMAACVDGGMGAKEKGSHLTSGLVCLRRACVRVDGWMDVCRSVCAKACCSR